MRPATVDDLTSVTSHLTRSLHLLDLNRTGENFFSHLIATTGSRNIRAHGPKGLGLPLELWHMIITLLKQDSNLNSGEYCFVTASPYPPPGNKNRDENASREMIRCTEYDLVASRDWNGISGNRAEWSRQKWAFNYMLKNPGKCIQDDQDGDARDEHPGPGTPLRKTNRYFSVALFVTPGVGLAAESSVTVGPRGTAPRNPLAFDPIIPCLMVYVTPQDVIAFMAGGRCHQCEGRRVSRCRDCSDFTGAAYPDNGCDKLIICSVCMGFELASRQHFLKMFGRVEGVTCNKGLHFEEDEVQRWRFLWARWRLGRPLAEGEELELPEEDEEDVSLRLLTRKTAKAFGYFTP